MKGSLSRPLHGIPQRYQDHSLEERMSGREAALMRFFLLNEGSAVRQRARSSSRDAESRPFI